MATVIRMPTVIRKSRVYNYRRNVFTPNLEGVAQKIGLPSSFEVLNVFGRKSVSLVPRAFIFGEKRVSLEIQKW